MSAPVNNGIPADVSLKMFLLKTLLWLPLSFFFWFLWASALVMPVQLLCDLALGGLLAEQFRDISQSGYTMLVEIYFQAPDGTRVSINPMIYGYGLPLLAGLVISTPNSIIRRTLQIFIGYLSIVMVQSWGTVAEVLKNLTFAFGPEGRLVMEQVGISPTLVALIYQFGYLILPAVTPVVLWILLNRQFVEGIISSGNRDIMGSAEETREDDSGQ